jgi:hypothetical protein
MQQSLQFYYLTFIYSSKCFGRSHAHHQELNNCSSSLWFYLSKGKTRGSSCSCCAPDDGREDARNMLSCKKMSNNNTREIVAPSW